MNSVDLALCKATAKVWVDGGGDVDGFDYCLSMLRTVIMDEFAEQNEREIAAQKKEDMDTYMTPEYH